MKPRNVVSIGFRAKTGRAIAVVLGGTSEKPIVLGKTEITLFDREVPETAQPYHAVMDLPWKESERAARKYTRVIEKIARDTVTKMLNEQASNGNRVSAIGIVGSADRDLTKIGNPHIRAHAAEGILFRRVLDLAAEANGLRWRTFSDQTLTTGPGHRGATLRQKIEDLRTRVPAPWRAEEKQAATAAWLVLHGEVR